MMSSRERADQLLLRHGHCCSREQAQRLILAGKVRLGADHLVHKPSEKYPAETEFTIDEPYPYVSRGAEKLIPALDNYLPDLTGLTVFDVGASTGGFTDLMLQRGAAKVYTVDVGKGQLHDKLRRDSRVIYREGINARFLPPDFLPEQVDVLSMDVSFISVRLILPAAAPFLKPGGLAFILVKPQFEAGRKEVGKGGVVRDDGVRQRCVEELAKFAECELDWRRLAAIDSPLAGPKGNREIVLVLESSQQ